MAERKGSSRGVQALIMFACYAALCCLEARAAPVVSGTPEISGKAVHGSKTKEVPDICKDPRVDAMFTTAERDVYVFKGKYYWKITPNDIAPGYPKLIAETWEGLPDNIDFASERKNGRTFFIKGSTYWSYEGTKLAAGYPKKIEYGIEATSAFMDLSGKTFQASKLSSSDIMITYCIGNNIAAAL